MATITGLLSLRPKVCSEKREAEDEAKGRSLGKFIKNLSFYPRPTPPSTNAPPSVLLLFSYWPFLCLFYFISAVLFLLRFSSFCDVFRRRFVVSLFFYFYFFFDYATWPGQRYMHLSFICLFARMPLPSAPPTISLRPIPKTIAMSESALKIVVARKSFMYIARKSASGPKGKPQQNEVEMLLPAVVSPPVFLIFVFFFRLVLDHYYCPWCCRSSCCCRATVHFVKLCAAFAGTLAIRAESTADPPKWPL